MKVKPILIIMALMLFGCKKECIDGKNSLINCLEEPVGINCSSGGFKIISGIDLNSNNTLDEDEIQNTKYICNSILDKEIIINLAGGFGNNSVDPYLYIVNLPYFNVTSYQNLTSIIFAVADIKTSDYSFNDVIGEGTFELFDLTNNKVIENSIIKSDDIPNNTYKSSINLINSIPKERINLGVRVTSGGNFNSRCGNIYLILTRK